ncbi:fumarylacetoacetate hydrolase family protein [Novosphingobium sp. 9]|uniref:fumarylacetoacetate hydrolase family protein n=1 Tax=Novosphingobium sp. 9 TaxID=2025349 RepID=UPI0021B6D60F|nr:fumarylacetoacetate hydrolase family protein [Novosphingobium sp. 9]
MNLLFDLPPAPTVPIAGSDTRFPVGRVFLVGRNYEDHAKEMGAAVDREAPVWFSKFASTVCVTPATIPYAPGTENYHYEMELVVALGAGGFRVAPEDAMDLVTGYACGLDMTRRDLQSRMKSKQYPWDVAKNIENGAVIGPITPAAQFGEVSCQRIRLTQNGTVKQDATLDLLIWSLPELIADLSKLYHLQAGDLIYTGTPAGVGPVQPGDVLVGEVDGCEPIELRIAEAE